MPYYDPLSSLSMAPTASQLAYRETAGDRVGSFVSNVAPSIYAAVKNTAAAFEHSFVGDTYDEPFTATPISNSNSKVATELASQSSDGSPDPNILDLFNNPSNSPSGSGKVQAKPITYSDWSDAARYFGMNQATAYAEHMANTAHQREVADLRAAGLNPVLGMGSGASGVSGHVASSGGASSGRKSSDESGLVDTVGATIGFLAALLGGDTAGRFASKAVTGLGKLFEKK